MKPGAIRPKGGAIQMAEGKNLYETVIVTSAKLGEEGSAALVERFKNLIA